MIAPQHTCAELALRAAIERSNQDPIPRSIIVQLAAAADPELWLERLYREIELLSPLLARDRPVLQVQVVAAARADLSPASCNDLLQSLTQNFALSSSALERVRAQLKARGPAITHCATPTLADCDVLGLGPGGISHFGDLWAFNATDSDHYAAALDGGRLAVVRYEVRPHKS